MRKEGGECGNDRLISAALFLSSLPKKMEVERFQRQSSDGDWHCWERPKAPHMQVGRRVTLGVLQMQCERKSCIFHEEDLDIAKVKLQ